MSINRRAMLFGMLWAGGAVAAASVAGVSVAEAAMPVPPKLEPVATTADVKPERDVIPQIENARFHRRGRFGRRRMFVRRRRRVVMRRRRRYF
jgi:hypothetical protein